jgi:hypothetical protein
MMQRAGKKLLLTNVQILGFQPVFCTFLVQSSGGEANSL